MKANKELDYDVRKAAEFWSAHRSPDNLLNWWAQEEGLSPPFTPEKHPDIFLLAWAWQWADGGFWSFQCGHKMAAALMATSTAGCKGELEIPGGAVRLRIPDGILEFGGYHYRWLYLLTDDGGRPPYMFLAEEQVLGPRSASTNVRMTGMSGATLEHVLFAGDDDYEEAFPATTQVDKKKQNTKHKATILARRYAVGVLYTFQHSTHWREHQHSTPSCVSDRSPPDHRNVVIGSTMKEDFRSAIHAYMGATWKRRPPAVQHVVRGHYKRQAVGEGRAHRKVIWVEPYWRGPKGAPILVRPREVTA